MFAIEFNTNIKDGVIVIPEKYRRNLKKNVRVILLSDEKIIKIKHDIIDNLLESPLIVNNFKPLTRDEIYDRI